MFLSHTSELRRYPERGSYVAAAEGAVNAAGHCPVDMARFGAEDQKPAAVCERKVRECDVYVGIIGLRYGSAVSDRPKLSYTELEFETATAQGMHRLVFLLDRSSDLGMPADALSDLEHASRQEAFRQRLRQREDLTVREVRSPDHLALELERALGELAKGGATSEARPADWGGWGGAPAGGDGHGQASVAGKTAADWLETRWLLPHLPDRGRQDQALNEALETLRPCGRARPLTVITYGEQHQELDLYYNRFWEANLPDVIPEEIQPIPTSLDWNKVQLRGDVFDQLFEQVVRQCLPKNLRYMEEPPFQDFLIVLRSDLNSDDWVEMNGEEKLERICRYWREQGSGVWEGWRIIHWISIKMLHSKGRVRQGWRSRLLRQGCWRRRGGGREALQPKQRIRDRLAQVAGGRWQSDGVVVLEELDDVRRSCAESWVNDLGARKNVDLPPQAIQWLREEVESFYSQRLSESGSAAVPMSQLSQFLKQRLLKAADLR